MEHDHGPAAPQDPRGLRRLPRAHPRWPARRATHGIDHWTAGCGEISHVRFGGRPHGKGPAPRAPRRAAHPTEFGKDCFGLDEPQVRLYTAIARHTVLVMAALAISAITAARLRDRTNTQAPPPVRPGQPLRSRDDPADRPRDQTPAHRHYARPARPY